MVVTIAEAEKSLPELIRAVEAGEEVVITRHGTPVAQLNAPPPPPPERRKVEFGGMKGRIEFRPGWDDPIDEDEFLAGKY